MFKFFGSTLSLGLLVAANTAFAGPDDLIQGIQHAQDVVREVIAALSQSPNGEGTIAENDALALPVYIQAGTTLAKAATAADQYKIAFLSGNFGLANLKFATTCVKIGESRSQVARANTAAFTPPVGYVLPFGTELKDVVDELAALRTSEGCP